jgi:hypothetical protein
VLEVIVNEVQAHPILWSRQNPDYKRSDKKKIVWSAIAQKVGLEGNDLSKRLQCISKSLLLYFTAKYVTIYLKSLKGLLCHPVRGGGGLMLPIEISPGNLKHMGCEGRACLYV